MNIVIQQCLKKIKVYQNITTEKVYEKSIFVIYADTESLLEKIDTCHSNLKIHQQLK